MGKRIWFMLCIFLLCAVLMPSRRAYASPEDTDYHELFTRYSTDPWIDLRAYDIEVCGIYLTDPDRFITELSKEETATILRHAYYLPDSLKYENYTEDLNRQQANALPGSALADTILLLQYGNLLYETAAPDDFSVQTKYSEIQSVYHNNPRIFLLSQGMYRYGSPAHSRVAEAMVFGLNADQLVALDTQLAGFTDAEWATDGVPNAIWQIRFQINLEKATLGLTDVDYDMLFGPLYLVSSEDYDEALSVAFHAAPHSFITALSKQYNLQDYSESLAAIHQLDLDSYLAVLQTTLEAFPVGSEEYKTVLTLQMGALGRIDGSETFVADYHEWVQACYQNDPQVFITSLMSPFYTDSSIIYNYGAALTYGLPLDELTELDAQLASGPEDDWVWYDSNLTDILRTEVACSRFLLDPSGQNFHILFVENNCTDESHYARLYDLFRSEPNVFINALAQENTRTVAKFGYALAQTQQELGDEQLTAYQTALRNAWLQSKAEQPAADTITILHNAAIFLDDRAYLEIQNAYLSNKRLFLQTLSARYYEDALLDRIFQLLTYNNSSQAIWDIHRALEQSKTEDWVNFPVQKVIDEIQERIELLLGSDVSVSSPTEPTAPQTAAPVAHRNKTPANIKAIAIVVIVAVIIGSVLFMLAYAKRNTKN